MVSWDFPNRYVAFDQLINGGPALERRSTWSSTRERTMCGLLVRSTDSVAIINESWSNDRHFQFGNKFALNTFQRGFFPAIWIEIFNGSLFVKKKQEHANFAKLIELFSLNMTNTSRSRIEESLFMIASLRRYFRTAVDLTLELPYFRVKVETLESEQANKKEQIKKFEYSCLLWSACPLLRSKTFRSEIFHWKLSGIFEVWALSVWISLKLFQTLKATAGPMASLAFDENLPPTKICLRLDTIKLIGRTGSYQLGSINLIVSSWIRNWINSVDR